jgi:hypothetical protein
MSTAMRRNVLLAVCVLTLSLPLAPTAWAQARDSLSSVRDRQKIEAQRIEKEIRDGRMKAYRIVRSDPNEAYDVIKGLIGMLRKAEALPEAKHDELMKTLERDLTNLRALAGARRTSDPLASARHLEIRRTPDPRVSDDKKSAASVAAERIKTMTDRVADARSVRGQTADRYLGAMRQIDKSATPSASDYEFPPDWLEKTKKRSPGAKLTAQEKAILKALQKPVKVDYNSDTFQSVIEHLSKQMGQDILVDKQALEEVNVTYDSPVTLRFNKPISARSALKRVLADLGLTYVIRKEHIEVTTIARAKEMMTTRTYYIGDLIGVANPLMPAIVNQFDAIQAVGSILSSVQGIDPESWTTGGGAGTVTFDPVRMVLVVKQSAEMHYMLSGR